MRQEEENAKKKELAGDIKASWGDQMRSYVLQPYQMVKDLRTEHEVGNPSAVFDGDIDNFIEAGIRWRPAGLKEAWPSAGSPGRLIRATDRCTRARRVRPAGPTAAHPYPRDRATNPSVHGSTPDPRNVPL